LHAGVENLEKLILVPGPVDLRSENFRNTLTDSKILELKLFTGTPGKPLFFLTSFERPVKVSVH